MMPFSQPVWSALINAGVPRRFEREEVLMRQGDRGDCVLALASGRVKVIRDEADGGKLLLAIREADDLLGEVAVLDGRERSATVSALTPCLTYVIPAERFRRVVSQFSLYEILIHRTLHRMREGEDIRADLAGLAAPILVARTLVRLAIGPEIPLSQNDLAAATGLSRSAVAAELAVLRRRGIVTTARRLMIIHDLASLQKTAWP
ncbi:Crp/Fnr family transcriptional regulator [Streptosporangium saharense]|uniref:Crp/Fnr family transcriptional regulator n=1 Tax=Streptosporangium saharense TaxID=1706840 RepID=UPI00341955CF